MIVQKEILLNETIWQSYLLTIHFTIEDLRDKDNLEEYYYLDKTETLNYNVKLKLFLLLVDLIILCHISF